MIIMKQVGKKIMRGVGTSDFALGLASLAVLGIPSEALAAQGSSAAKPQMDINFTLGIRHDTNVARTDEALAASRGLKRADERVTPGVNINVVRPLGRNSLSVSGFVGYDFYRRNTRLNRERIGLSASAGINAGPCLLTLSPSIERGQSELGNIGLVSLPGSDSVKNTQTTQDYSAELRCGRRTGLRPLVGYERVIGDNSNRLRQISNFRSNKYTAGLGYSNPTLGDFTVTANRNDTQYPRRLSTGPNPFGGFRSDSLRVTAQRDIGSLIVANASISYTRLRPNLATVRTFNGLSWSLGATVRPTTRLSTKLAFSNTVSPSLQAAAVYQRARNLSANATYALTPRTSLKAGVSQDHHRYEGASAVYGPLLTNDTLTRFSAGASYSWNRKVQFNLDVGHERRNANGTIYDYSSSYVALTTSYKL